MMADNHRDLDSELDACDRIAERLDAFERAHTALRDACERRDAPAPVRIAYGEHVAELALGTSISDLRRVLLSTYDDIERERGRDD